MTTTLTIEDIDRQLADAREALAAAEEAEAAAYAAVDRDREGLALGRLVRGALQKTKLGLAARQECSAQARSAVRAWEKLSTQERERVAAAAHREKADRSAVLRVEAAALEARIGQFLVDIREEAATIDAEVAAFNAEAAGTFAATFRGPSTYGAWERIDDGLTVLGRFFPPPKRTTATPITNEKETR